MSEKEAIHGAMIYARNFFRWEGAPWDWAILVSALFLAFLAFAT